MKLMVPAVVLKTLATVVILLSQSVLADVLVMKNGDRITGEIKRIWDSEITIEPEYSDEFKVDLSAVSHMESDREFEIELEDGAEVVAQLGGLDSEGNQIVRIGAESISVPLAQFFELDEPEEQFDWESNIDFSADIKKGNTDTLDTKLYADTTVKMGDHRHIGDLTFLREELAGISTKEQEILRYNYNWLFRDPVFLSAAVSYERDPIIELDSRIIVSLGLGRDIWRTPRRALSVQLGAGFQTEKIGIESTDSAVAVWQLRYQHDFFGDNLELYHNHSIIPTISGRRNVSIRTTTGLRYEITDLLYLNTSLDFDYESEPVDNVKSEDVALLIGIGAEF